MIFWIFSSEWVNLCIKGVRNPIRQEYSWHKGKKGALNELILAEF